MAMARKLGLTLALALAFTPSARANPYVPIMRDSALAYWAERGVTGCPQGVTADIAALPGSALGWAIVGGCGVTIDGRLAADAAAVAGTSARGYRLYLRRERVRTLCLTVYHEVGHALGLGHEYGGAMAEAFYGDVEIPSDCFTYARDLVERKPRARTSRSPRPESGGARSRRPGSSAA